jgi:GPH family glycoside/pentoside/hexuronide:cation symporter
MFRFIIQSANKTGAAVSIDTAAKGMGLGRKIALGAGDFGFNLYWQMASLYLLFFYTDVAGLPPATAGTLYMAALIWDAALDPMIGMVADRTRSRMGRYRPYLLLGALPLALIYALMFMLSSAAGGALALTVAIHVAFRTIYAVVSIPYAALFARVTSDARIRADLAGIRIVFATLAAVLVAGTTLPLAHGLATPEFPRRGWVVIGVVSGMIATLALLLVVWATRGYDREELKTSPRHNLAQAAKALLSNRALLIILGAVMIAASSSTLFGKNLLYYFKYVLGREDLGGTALAVTALMTGLLVPPFAWAARTYGKRAAWLAGAVPSLAGLVLWHLADGMPMWILFVALGLCACGSAAYAVCFWAMLPDTVEYGEWRSGVRTESLVFGMAVLGQKAAIGIGAGMLGVALGHIGYVANAAQTAETLEGIKQMMFWLPLAGGLVSAGLITLYPITLESHASIVEEIAARKAAT